MSRAKLLKFDKSALERKLDLFGLSKRWLARQIGKEYTGFLKRFKSGQMQKAELLAIEKVLGDYEQENFVIIDDEDDDEVIDWHEAISRYDAGIYKINASKENDVHVLKTLGELLCEWARKEEAQR